MLHNFCFYIRTGFLILQKKSNKHRVCNVYSLYAYRPKVSSKARLLGKLCVILFLQPLQKSERAIFCARI